MAEMNELLREVQEDLRQERLEKLWKAYGVYIVAGLVGIVLLTVAFVFWRDYRTSQRANESAAYETAVQNINQGKRDQGIAQLEALAKEGGTYNGMAALNKASVLAEKSATKAEAVALYQSISKNKAYDATIRYLAGYYAVLHQVDTENSDVLLEQLPLLMVGANPWSVMVTELKAVLTLKAGRPEEAAQIYKDLLENPSTPSGIRIRAQAALNQTN